ncbi:S-layer homology domain-containing protein [Bradyrhizobium japonicum]
MDSKHPYYGAVRQAINYGFIPKETRTFAPDRLISRIEALDMVFRMLGYEQLLDKKDIFKETFRDVNQAQLPAAALAAAFGLVEVKSAQDFQPDSPMTKADVAVLYQKLNEIFSEK